MKIGVISDTHSDRAGAIPHILKEFEKRNIDIIVHCGDIEIQHIGSDTFGGFEVFCALNNEQLEKLGFENLLKNPPPKWTFTVPDQRVLDLHQASFLTV